MFSGGHSSHLQLFMADCENSGGCPQYLLTKLFSEGISKFITSSPVFPMNNKFNIKKKIIEADLKEKELNN